MLSIRGTKMFPLRVLQLYVVFLYLNSQLQWITALQCYYCENCDENEELQELHICGELPPMVTQVTEVTKVTEDNSRLTTATSNENSITDTNTLQSPNETRTTTTTTTESVTVVEWTNNTATTIENSTTALELNSTTTAVVTSPLTTTTTPTSTSTHVDNYDYDEEFDYAMARKAMAQPICYMITSIFNGTVLINRGCTELENNNDAETCAAIQTTAGVGVSVLHCQLCNTNGCNKFAATYSQITAAANHFQYSILSCVVVLAPFLLL